MTQIRGYVLACVTILSVDRPWMTNGLAGVFDASIRGRWPVCDSCRRGKLVRAGCTAGSARAGAAGGAAADYATCGFATAGCCPDQYATAAAERDGNVYGHSDDARDDYS